MTDNFPKVATCAPPTFYRTYSRKVDGKRETWLDVVHRTTEGLIKLGNLTPEEGDLIRKNHAELTCLTSGRWLWVGGTAWIENPVNFPGAYNCLRGDTLVLTRHGAVPIQDLVQDYPVEVVNGNGDWVPVTFKSYGTQAVVPTVFTRKGGVEKTVFATTNHEWITSRGKVATDALVPGDKIERRFAPKPQISPEGVRHGIIFGDGTSSGGRFFVDLQGEKFDDLKHWFSDVRELKWQNRAYAPGVELKSLPPADVSPGYLRGFIVGLLATDGTARGSVSISGNRETIDFLATHAASVGYEVNSTSLMYPAGEQSNVGVRKSDVWRAYFCRASLDESDFLRKKHLQDFLRTSKGECYWSVKSVGDALDPVEVFCCEEPDTHAFCLSDGLLTGNCTSTIVEDWRAFGLMMDLAMMGCGTGAVLEQEYIDLLPPICNRINLLVNPGIGSVPESERIEHTEVSLSRNRITIDVGDSRQGWVRAYQALMEIASDDISILTGEVDIEINLGNVRPKHAPIKGFGGVANPEALPKLFTNVVKVLNRAVGRQLTSVECCLIIDEAGLAVVAGNVRRSAGMRQFSATDLIAAVCKDNLWQQDEQGNWTVDPDRDALRMANHTRVFHQKPTRQEVLDAVTKQFYSGEGAIQYAPEAIARANVDLLPTPRLRQEFITAHENGQGGEFLTSLYDSRYSATIPPEELTHRLRRYGLNPCFAADTQILTDKGNFAIQDLVGQTVTVFDGEEWVTIDNFRVTGHYRPMVRVYLSTGDFVRTTTNHPFILADGSRVNAENLKEWDQLQYHNIGGDRDPEDFIVERVEPDGTDESVYCCTVLGSHRIALANGLVTGQCGEIIGSVFDCNLSEVHLNQIDPEDFEGQLSAFKAGGLSVAVLLHHVFTEERFRVSRELDPIVGVSFTGLFDFFVKAFGVEWLHWWAAGRPDAWGKTVVGHVDGQPPQSSAAVRQSDLFRLREQEYLELWRDVVQQTVWDYCDRHGLKRPNRCTTVQPGGTKSLLTGASSGWHPPKAARFIRRITFRRDDPVALACMDYGYKVVPSQSCCDDQGVLLDDPFDPRSVEWLVEIPTAAVWADVPGADEVDISQFSALAQFDFYMQVQRHYTTHNTSATIEYRSDEIESLADAIYNAIQEGQGYISAALLARFDDLETFPRLPFEPIDRATYDRLCAEVQERRISDDFYSLLDHHGLGQGYEQGPTACDSEKCEMPLPG